MIVTKKWVRIVMLILGIIMTAEAVTQLYCVIFKPDGYEKIVRILGNEYWVQLFFGIWFIVSYFLLRNYNKKRSREALLESLKL